jgi:hypothetical protein
MCTHLVRCQVLAFVHDDILILDATTSDVGDGFHLEGSATVVVACLQAAAGCIPALLAESSLALPVER